MESADNVEKEVRVDDGGLVGGESQPMAPPKGETSLTHSKPTSEGRERRRLSPDKLRQGFLLLEILGPPGGKVFQYRRPRNKL